MAASSLPTGNAILPVKLRDKSRHSRRMVYRDLSYSVSSSSGSSSSHGSAPTVVAFQHPITARKRHSSSHNSGSTFSDPPSVTHDNTSTSSTLALQSGFRFREHTPSLEEPSRAAEDHRNYTLGQEEAGNHTDGLSAKKGKGMTGILVDGALTAALYTGAAAVTAYSMWSGWGKREEEEKEEEQQIISFKEEGDNTTSVEVEEPPPPYMEERSGTPTEVEQVRKLISPTKSAHIFVSSRRRRPAFQSVKASHRDTPKRNSAHVSTVLDSRRLHTSEVEQEESEANESEDDELFTRLQSQMSSLIEEGNKALSSQPILKDEATGTASFGISMSPSLLKEEDPRCFTPSPQQSPPIRQSHIPISPIRYSHSVAAQNRHLHSPPSRIPRLQTHKDRLQ